MLVRLLFASRAAEPAAATIVSICQHSQPRNAERGITGVLVCGDGVFMQAIEGGRAAVNSLYGEIQRDARHRPWVLLRYTIRRNVKSKIRLDNVVHSREEGISL